MKQTVLLAQRLVMKTREVDEVLDHYTYDLAPTTDIYLSLSDVFVNQMKKRLKSLKEEGEQVQAKLTGTYQ